MCKTAKNIHEIILIVYNYFPTSEFSNQDLEKNVNQLILQSKQGSDDDMAVS